MTGAAAIARWERRATTGLRGRHHWHQPVQQYVLTGKGRDFFGVLVAVG